MIIDTAKWMYKEFESHKVDFIVNCGDTVDSSVLKADELSALKEFYSYSRGVQEWHIVGNHELSDKNFYATKILDQLDFISVVSSATRLIDNNCPSIAFIPYVKPEYWKKNGIDILRSIEADICFSHIDINGSKLRGTYIIEDGIDPEILAQHFKVVINGHLHTAEKIETSQNAVYNIGSVSSNSFVDSNEYIPSICILDTDTMQIQRINNPHSILFRTYHCNDTKDIMTKISSLNQSYRYILHIKCPYGIRDDIKNIISEHKNIIASRVTVDVSTGNSDIKNTINVSDVFSFDVEKEFFDFLKKTNCCSYGSYEDYIELLK
jgi:predicted phosphodiesterase